MPFALAFAQHLKEVSALADPPLGEGPVTAAWDTLAGAVEDALRRGETHYTDRPGILPLRRQVAAMLQRRFEVPFDPSASTLITCSVIESRFVALQQLLAPGDRVWAPPSLLPRIQGAARLRRATVVSDAGAAKIVFLASSLGEAMVREYLITAADSSLILFEVDDPEFRFHPAQLSGFADRTVTIGPLGHPSWQLGYLVAPPGLAAGLRDFKQALTICSTNLSQWAALAAMEAQ